MTKAFYRTVVDAEARIAELIRDGAISESAAKEVGKMLADIAEASWEDGQNSGYDAGYDAGYDTGKG